MTQSCLVKTSLTDYKEVSNPVVDFAIAHLLIGGVPKAQWQNSLPGLTPHMENQYEFRENVYK